MLPIRNMSYLLPMCCSFLRKMHKQSKNWPGVQYPLKETDTFKLNNKSHVMVSHDCHMFLCRYGMCCLQIMNLTTASILSQKREIIKKEVEKIYSLKTTTSSTTQHHQMYINRKISKCPLCEILMFVISKRIILTKNKYIKGTNCHCQKIAMVIRKK